MGLSGAVTESRLAGLQALRDVLALQIEVSDGARDVAVLARQLIDVLEQIEVVERAVPSEKGSPLDELEKRRVGRQSGASGRARPQGGVVAR